MMIIVFPKIGGHVSGLSQSCVKTLKINSKSKIQLRIPKLQVVKKVCFKIKPNNVVYHAFKTAACFKVCLDPSNIQNSLKRKGLTKMSL